MTSQNQNLEIYEIFEDSKEESILLGSTARKKDIVHKELEKTKKTVGPLDSPPKCCAWYILQDGKLVLYKQNWDPS